VVLAALISPNVVGAARLSVGLLHCTLLNALNASARSDRPQVVFQIPLSEIDPATNQVIKQFTGSVLPGLPERYTVLALFQLHRIQTGDLFYIFDRFEGSLFTAVLH
jgi:hypothetical protein